MSRMHSCMKSHFDTPLSWLLKAPDKFVEACIRYRAEDLSVIKVKIMHFKKRVKIYLARAYVNALNKNELLKRMVNMHH